MSDAVGIIAAARKPAAGGGWTPVNLPNLVGWFNTGSYSGGSTWDNLGGPVDLTRSAATSAIRDVGGGRNMVCSYATGSLQTAQWTGAFGTLTQPVTVAIASWWSSNSITDHQSFNYWTGVTGGDMRVLHWTASQLLSGYGTSIPVPRGLRDNAAHVVASQHNGGSNGSWIDVDGVRWTGNNSPDPTTNLSFGELSWVGWNTGSPTVFGYGEIVVVDGTISAGDLTSLYTYLKTSWGTP